MDSEILLRKLRREKEARKQAEAILEKKALELYQANEDLRRLNETLEGEIELRTIKMLSSEQQYRDLVETIDEVIYHADRSGVFTFMNHNGPARFGYSLDEMLGQAFEKFVHPDDVEKTKAFYAKMLKENLDQSYFQFRIISKNGQIRWIGQSVKSIKEKGEIIKFAAVARDITERNQLMEDLRNAKELAENSQLAEKQFLASMSHEIRTPLNAIIGMSHLLEDTNLNKDQNEYVEVLLNSSKILHTLISDVLDMSKIDSGNIEIQEKDLDLRALLKNIEKTFAIKLENQTINMKLQIDEGIDTYLIGDELLLNQIFFNLLGNAEKFTDEGSISLRAKILESNDEFVKIHFEVKDTGIGISKDNLNNIFEKFKQVSDDKKYSYGGTGLGLPITKRIITLMGGDLEVESIEGLGSVFHFEIQFKNTGKAISQKTNHISNTGQFVIPELAILVVEDNPMNQKYIGRLLNKWKLPFEFANHGKEAIEMCQAKQYALIFMDLQMPILDGFEAALALKTIQNKNSNTPIIALTASSLLSIKKQTKEIGMNDFLSKPFNPSQLKEVLVKYFPFKAQQDQNMEEFEAAFRFNKELNENYLADNYGSDLSYALDMFQTFITSFSNDYALFNESIKNKDIKSCGMYAHKIKPIFTMVGLNKITAHFDTLESLSKNENWEGFVSYFRKVEQEIVNCLALIKVETVRLEKFISHQQA